MNDLAVPADALLAADQRYLIHPLHHPNDHAQARIFTEGRGAMLRTNDGREFIDGLSCLWNVNIGHGRKELADAAQQQMAKLAYAGAYAGFSNEPAIRLAERIVSAGLPNSRRSTSPPAARNRTKAPSSSPAITGSGWASQPRSRSSRACMAITASRSPR